MDEAKKEQVIAQLENVEDIRNFFTDWWSVADLYETAAKATCTLMYVMGNSKFSDEEKHEIRSLIDQHLMMIDLIKPFEKKEDDAHENDK